MDIGEAVYCRPHLSCYDAARACKSNKKLSFKGHSFSNIKIDPRGIVHLFFLYFSTVQHSADD